MAKEGDATLNQYLAAGLIQPSPSLYSIPLVVIPKKSGDVRITVSYQKLNKISSLSQLPIPRVDQVLDSMGKGRVFSLLNLVSSFHQFTAHKDTVLLTAFDTSTVLYVARHAPGPQYATRVVRQGKQPEYIGLGTGARLPRRCDRPRFRPAVHVNTMRALFERLRKHNLTFSPSKAFLGATDTDRLGHSISLAGVRPNAENIPP